MSDKLPAGFDAEWYRSTYPDVDLTEMDPNEHFLRLGRALGRPACAEKSDAIAPTASRQDSLLDDLRLSLGNVDFGPFPNRDLREQLSATLASYAYMMKMQTALNPAGKACCGGGLFRRGETEIKNAWFVTRNTLRLMISGPSGLEEDAPSAAPAGWTLQAYQGDFGAPGVASRLGGRFQLPDEGPIFCDIELMQPLAPFLLELSDSAGVVRDLALFPFPSLLPGGLHGTELKALQAETNPMVAFWSLSEALLEEYIGASEKGGRSIVDLTVVLDGASGAEPVFSPDVQEWLVGLFGLRLHGVISAKRPSEAGETTLQESLEKLEALPEALRVQKLEASPAEGLRLCLPGDCMPTVRALVSRRLMAESCDATSYLVAEAGSFRPRWSVSLPVDLSEAAVSVPRLERLGPPPNPVSEVCPMPIHLAIAFRSMPDTRAARMLMPVAPDAPAGAENQAREKLSAVSLLLDVSDEARTEAFLRGLAGLQKPEILIRAAARPSCPPVISAKMRAVLDRLCADTGWHEIPAGTSLHEVARQARHDLLLVASDQVTLYDPSALPGLIQMLGAPSVAAASCLLLNEVVVKKHALLQPATAGLFPSGVSFYSSPRLWFSEPDVLEALPDMTYPVVANTQLFTLFRRDALASLPLPSGPVPATAEDIQIGLDLMGAGWRSLCTTRYRAGLAGGYQRRDVIDPVGGAYLQPRGWEEILNSVTVLRELF